MGVIARPFAEGAFAVGFFFRRRHLAFDDDLRSCRHGQSGVGRADHFERRAAQGAGVFIFADARFRRRRRGHPGRRLAAEHDGDRTGFAGLPVFAGDLLAMLLLDDPERQAVFADDAGAVGADVDPAAVGIFDHHHVAGADIAAAVMLVPLGRRENS